MKYCRFLSFIILLSLLLTLVFPCFATETVTEETEESSQTAPLEDMPTGFDTVPKLKEYAYPTDYDVSCKGAALIELNSQAIVYGYELDRQLYPASLTKIMTCMLALEHGNLQDVLTVSGTALENLSVYGSTAGLMEGEEISLEELLYCIMVSSANEGCNVIAEHISGSVSAFVDLMNQKAKQLGMSGTHYANTHGLHNDEHYTTVRDLAVLACWAWQNPQFRIFATTVEHTVPATNMSEERFLRTTNYLTDTATYGRYYYEKASGIKTGFTTPAGGCLAATATNGDLAFLSVVCGCEMLIDYDGSDLDMRFVETRDLFDYGFETFTQVQIFSDTTMLDQKEVQNGDSSHVVLHAKDNVTVPLPAGYDRQMIEIKLQYDSPMALQAPLEEGQRVGTATAVYNGIVLATSDLVTLTAVNNPAAQMQEDGQLSSETGDPVVVPPADKNDDGFGAFLLKYWYVTIPFTLVLLLICWLLILRGINIYRAKQRAKRRRQQGAARRSRYD